MKVTEHPLPALPPHWGQSCLPTARSTGTHLTQIIDLYLEETGRGQKNKGFGFTSKEATFEVGFAWEVAWQWVIEQAVKQRFDYARLTDDMVNEWAEVGRRFGGMVQMGEVHKDGIACSLDGWLPDTKTVVDTKAVWESSKKFDIRNRTKWLMQIKGYCAVMRARKATFPVLFVMGDWSPRPDGRQSGPCPRVVDVEFEQREIDDNWRLITEFARGRKLIPAVSKTAKFKK